MQLAIGITVAAVAVIMAIAATAMIAGGRPPAVSSNRAVVAPPSSLLSISSPATAASTPAAVAQTVTPTSPYQIYSDVRYGFSFELPSSYRQRAALSSSDTAAFQSPDGDVTVTVFEHPRQPADNPLQAEVAAKTRLLGNGGQPTYLTHGASNYIVSGWTADGNVYYEFGYLGSSGEGGFTFTYPRATKPASDPLVTRAYQTFEPGSL